MKKMTVILTIVTILLGVNNIQLNSIVEVKSENIKIIENENTLLNQQIKNNNVEIAKYKNIVDSFNDMEVVNLNYVYYPVDLTVKEQEHLQNLAYNNNFSYELILSIIFTESRFDKNAISSSNCLGLMQLNERYLSTYSELANIENPDPFDAMQNATMGIAYLNYLREYWKSQGVTADEQLYVMMLNSYNMGISSYSRFIKENNTYGRTYDQLISKYKMQLETGQELY